MEENKIFQDQTENMAVLDEQKENVVSADGKKPLDVAALVLGIVTVIFAFLMPIVSYACGIIGLVFAIKHRKNKRTTAALILCIVGIVVAVICNVVAAKEIMEMIQPYLEQSAT